MKKKGPPWRERGSDRLEPWMFLLAALLMVSVWTVIGGWKGSGGKNDLKGWIAAMGRWGMLLMNPVLKPKSRISIQTLLWMAVFPTMRHWFFG